MDNVKIYQILIVAGRGSGTLPPILLSVARHWNTVPVVMKIYGVGQTLAYWKNFLVA
jgi:hypothetical protein